MREVKHSFGNNAVFSNILSENTAVFYTTKLPHLDWVKSMKIRQNFPFSSVENVVKRGAKSQRRNFTSTNSNFWKNKNDALVYIQGTRGKMTLLSDYNIFLLLLIIIISIPLKLFYYLLYITASIFPNERKAV